VVPSGLTATLNASGPGFASVTARVGTFTRRVLVEVRAVAPVMPVVRWRPIAARAEVGAHGGGRIVLLDQFASYTSADGVEWERHSLTLSSVPQHLLHNGVRFVALGRQGGMTSVDGISWTTIPDLSEIEPQVAIGLGTVSVVAARAPDGSGITYRSTDGLSWQVAGRLPLPLSWIVTNGTELLGYSASQSRVFASADTGRTWSPRANLQVTVNLPSGRPVWDGRQYVSMGNGVLSTSPTGASWTLRPIRITWGAPGGAQAVFPEELVFDGTRFVAVVVVRGVPTRSAILESSDGIEWREATTGALGFARGIVRGPGMSLLVLGDGVVQRAPDGRWVGRLLPETSGRVKSAEFGVDRFVLVTPNGQTLLVGRGGTEWDAIELPSPGGQGTANTAIWTGTQYVVGTGRGGILTSPDGRSWTSRPTGISSNVLRLLSAGGRILALTQSGVLVSTDGGATFRVSTTMAFPDNAALGWTGTRFVLVEQDRRFQSSVDGTTWSPGTLPIRVGPGTLARFGDALVHVSSHVIRTTTGESWSLVGNVDRQTATARGGALIEIGPLLAGCSSSDQLLVSADARSWFPLTVSTTPVGCEAVASGAGRILLATRSGIFVGVP
jgi:hypothetical protein